MKRLLFIPLLFIALVCSATNYHFANAGDDATGDGSIATPYKTITKLNALWAAGTLAPGDSVCFKAGDTFTGTITVTESGTSGSPIIIGKYWTGDNPVISGFTTLSSWTDEGGSVYSKAVTSAAQTNMVLVDGTQVAMGRYPNAGTNLSYNAHSGTTTITDAGIGDATDWAGAELVINKNDWSLDRCLITDHTGDVFTYTNLGGSDEPINNRYYFIQNDLRCVTATNEWYHDYSGGKFYIYGNPAAKTVKIATVNYLLYNNGYDYIEVNDLYFEGSISHGIYFNYYSDGCEINNCTVKYAGLNGIHFYGVNGVIDGNTISNCNWAGIFKEGSTTGSTVTNNTISDIGLLAGQAYWGAYSVGIYSTDRGGLLIQYNSINKTGWSGIYVTSGTAATIKNNYIVYAMQLLNDGAGIYTGGGTSARTIEGNIVLYSGVGTVAPGTILIEGIYVDSWAQNVTVKDNIVAHGRYSGIKNNLGGNNTYTGNLCFNNGVTGIAFYGDGSVSGTTMNNNYFIAKGASQLALRFFSSVDDIDGFGISDNNYFARPIDDDDVFFWYPSQDYGTLAQWKTFTGGDAASDGSPVSVADTADIDFYYSLTDANTIPLPYASIEMDGTKHASDITLDAYEGIVLLKDPDPDSDPPDPPVVTTDAVTDVTSTTATCGGNVTSDGGGTVSARGVCWSLTPNPTTSDSKTSDGTGTGAFVSSITGLIPNTTYYVRAYATSEIATVYGTNMEFFTTKGKVLTYGDKILMSGSKVLVID